MRTILNERDLLERLCHADPAKRVIVTPIVNARDQFQPASFDVRLGTEFQTFRISKFPYLDILASPERARRELRSSVERYRLGYDGRFVLHPGDFALGVTLEYLKLPHDVAARLEGKSTWGRVGLQVHSTAGFVDPGFEGCLTFELTNAGKVPIPLYPGLRVAQLCFFELEATGIPYGWKESSLYGKQPGLVDSGFYHMREMEALRKVHSDGRG